MGLEKKEENIFLNIAHTIQAKNPLQRKMINNVLTGGDEKFWKRINSFSKGFETLLNEQNITPDKVADCYVKLCKDMLLEQIKFKKTGRYSSTSFAEVADRVYHSVSEMEAMVYGLAMSQFLWRNHYGLFDFFIETIKEVNINKEINNYLEIGPGHGLHLVESIRQFSTARFDVVDISAISLDLSKNIIKHFVPNSTINFYQQDVCLFNGASSYDLVVINEVLEHLENPLKMMKRINQLIGKNGLVFLTTCANAPSIDHIFLYDSVEAIQDQIIEAGFEILQEKILPVEAHIPRSQWKEKRVEVNYGALCRSKVEDSNV